MGIYPIACSLVPDKNHPFNKNPLVFAPQKSEVTVMTMARWQDWAGAVILPGSGCLVLPGLLGSLQPLMPAHNLEGSPIFTLIYIHDEIRHHWLSY